MDYNIKHVNSLNRFELDVEGHIAHIDYVLNDSIINFTHTWVPKELEGKGIGSALTKHALEYARINSLKVIPSCPFVKVYIDRHPDFLPLLINQQFLF